MKSLKITLKGSLLVCSTLALCAAASNAFARQSAPIICDGYEAPKTKLLGERTGRSLQAALEAYNEDRIPESVEILKEMNPREPFDKASVDRFLGQILVSMDGDNFAEAGKLLASAANSGVLNDRDQADLLKLNGDLSLQEEDYEAAIDWYDRWMEFTCKSDASTYTKIAKAYTELKAFDDVLVAADKAIALQEKPDKNPYALKVNALHEQKNYVGAVGVAEILVELFPEEKQWWTQLGFFYMLIEDYEKALATFSVAYKQGFLTKKSEYKALIQLYASNEIPHKSAELHQKYMEAGMVENDAGALATLANTLHQAKEFKEAADFYGKAGAMDNDPENYRKRGALLLTAEDYKGAVTALNKALELGTQDESKVHFSLMEAHFYNNDFRQANVHAEEARKDPTLRRNANAWIPYIKEKAKNRGINL
ncbi:hypothetical protein KJ365_08325 [Glaciecola sp. XM2]|jgi:tetratricopeptide (TPR) repeat protein|uniref:hypothetical protein n=1 Tax=Glaciecola sp. XM2 TaxID=1914931 RepID=UPI001BDE0506|nr:hypothetical protein [Glaciecola sp. XM2]MBT1450886.1 hypothetical protein [Glaciecola sp. XM2]